MGQNKMPIMAMKEKIPQRLIEARKFSVKEIKSIEGLRINDLRGFKRYEISSTETSLSYMILKDSKTIKWIKRKIEELRNELIDNKYVYKKIMESMLKKEFKCLNKDIEFHGSFYSNIEKAIELDTEIELMELPF